MDAVYDSNNFSGSLSGLELTEGWEIGGGLLPAQLELDVEDVDLRCLYRDQLRQCRY